MNLNKCETSGNQNRLVEVDFVAVTYRFWWEKKRHWPDTKQQMNEQDWKQKKNTHKNRKHITYCDRGWSVEVEKSIFCLLIKVYSFPEIDCMTFQPKNVRQFAVSKFRIFRVHELSLGLFILSHSWLYLNFNFNSAHFKIFHYVARSSMHTLHTPAILLEDLKMCCECNTQVETSFSFFSHNYNTIWFAVLLFYWAR